MKKFYGNTLIGVWSGATPGPMNNYIRLVPRELREADDRGEVKWVPDEEKKVLMPVLVSEGKDVELAYDEEA